MENAINTIKSLDKKTVSIPLGIGALTLLAFLLGKAVFFEAKNIKVTEATPTLSPAASPEESSTVTPKNQVQVKVTPKATPSPTVQPTVKPATPIPTQKAKPLCLGPKPFLPTNSSGPFTVIFTPQFSAYLGAIQWDFTDKGNWSEKMSDNAPSYTYQIPGTYTVKMRVIDANGESSECQTTFTLPSESVVSLKGQVYNDKNCNSQKDEGEDGISGVTVNIFKKPEFYIYQTLTTDGSGNYSFEKNLDGDETLSLQPIDVASSGHKIYFDSPTISLSKSSRNVTVNLPQVPNENISSCTI